MQNDPIARWLVEDAVRLPDVRSILKGLVDRFEEDGLPIMRLHIALGVLHPEIFAAVYNWERGDSFVRRYDMPHGIERTDLFRNSPFRSVIEGETVVRRRLTGPAARFDFPVLEEICDAGGTDFLAMALPRSDGMINPCSFATDRSDGFSAEEIERIVSLRRLMALVVELKGQTRGTQTLLDLYLGPEAGNRVYRGQIKRGGSATIRSVLWMSDLRRFTRLSEDLPLEPLTVALNDYFDAVIGPIQAHGGEVLKLMGDGVLGIFRIESDTEVAMMCEAALNAAALAIANMRLLNRRRARSASPALECGIALHVGDVMYGNVGAHNRLDFTVIGPAVNLCARLEALAGELGERIVCSADFVSHSDVPMRSLGSFELKNLDGVSEVFAPEASRPN